MQTCLCFYGLFTSNVVFAVVGVLIFVLSDSIVSTITFYDKACEFVHHSSCKFLRSSQVYMFIN